ncbi:ATP-binding protein [Holdemanella biformis]|uniref:ATP-binding protein n=2 Tax=Holdemanella porci TaxID=2652276 RepID=A0A6N7V2I9_9FIRM|nr:MULTISPECIES: ATP-binding protein [Holdemanella]MEE0079950.1 ATP-binding protein [Holdemanella sp.]MSS56503.1 ATP-binding protein [Holdemanella porci]
MNLYKREKYLKKIRPFYSEEDLIKVITGVRRCGKSSLMETICDELKQTMGVKDEQIIYIDLDSRKNRNIKTADALETLIESQTTPKEKIYLFIDEIQNVDSFEEVINGYRTDGGYSIFITGSNSYLLSGELSTKLTGRYIEFELYTLSFDEYLEMKRFYNKDINPNTIVELNNYILEGGFPRTIQFDDLQVKRTYTESVVREIFEKDIRKRVKIRNREAFESVEHFIINNFGATTSISGLQESLEKNGMKISRATLSNYIKILVDAKILYECSRFDMKSKKSLSGEKKYYVSDLSFYFSLNTDNKINYGPVLENIVYFYAKSQGYSISVGRIGKLECDFILRDHKMNYAYVQVAYTIALSKKTEDREYKSLESIRDNYPKYVMTTDYLLQNRNGIKHVNLIDFIISNSKF